MECVHNTQSLVNISSSVISGDLEANFFVSLRDNWVAKTCGE